MAEDNVARDRKQAGLDYLLILNSNGKVKWQFLTISKSFCRIDIMEFPFDTQVTALIFFLFQRILSIVHFQ